VSAKTSEAAAGERWLEELESTVRQAGETIDELRREKAELEARVKELEAGAGSETESERDDGTAAWREERQEIRGRVEKLTERLESLLDEDGE
jgi:FtsZ-binding cell division protein ZapB